MFHLAILTNLHAYQYYHTAVSRPLLMVILWYRLKDYSHIVVRVLLIKANLFFYCNKKVE